MELVGLFIHLPISFTCFTYNPPLLEHKKNTTLDFNVAFGIDLFGEQGQKI